ncbi:MAG: formylmethanofuran dehydrogenase subunit region [Chloroflexi bacterium]|jgi:formylmethanofuran dehydrogenase subunit E|nr:formylmethanofuran dehydrogenase subunit region [Chloroflexota bacterium]
MDEKIQQVRDFHGHFCPGLSIGIRAAQISLREIGAHSQDEEVVAIVETDMCAVDAIQFLTGCTFGKGNLIHRDYGKNAYTFIRRSDNKSIRVVTKPFEWGQGVNTQEFQTLNAKIRDGGGSAEDKKRFWELQELRSLAVLEMPEEHMFEVQEIEVDLPKKARIHNSLICEECGESTMETRMRRFNGHNLCLPCFQKAEER